ncbi:MAG: hypothetical protein IBX50_02995 [Marinospirillum sp.]|uniref:hypothetical protein n=1 Tax=Marinospirillum sp. TaxID=2183934 RepID=UPI0019F79161|nr:hypothetical protein [Marinospirillum sp.]MBE0505671.1 hypothetical protein [Marinospirillum sp.]
MAIVFIVDAATAEPFFVFVVDCSGLSPGFLLFLLSEAGSVKLSVCFCYAESVTPVFLFFLASSMLVVCHVSASYFKSIS